MFQFSTLIFTVYVNILQMICIIRSKINKNQTTKSVCWVRLNILEVGILWHVPFCFGVRRTFNEG